MNEIYLHRDDIEKLLALMNSFPDRDMLCVTSDTSSGVGAVVKASIIGAVVNGHVVTVTKDIVDETSW